MLAEPTDIILRIAKNYTKQLQRSGSEKSVAPGVHYDS